MYTVLSKYNRCVLFLSIEEPAFIGVMCGTNGKVLLLPLAFAGCLCGLQMRLGVKGWLRGLDWNCLVNNLTVLYADYTELFLIRRYLTNVQNNLIGVQNHLMCDHNHLMTVQSHLTCVHSHLLSVQNHLMIVQGHLTCVHSQLMTVQSHLTFIHSQLM